MLAKQQFPILEFDCNKKAKLEPGHFKPKKKVPKYCVITFFAEVIKGMLESGRLKQIGLFESECMSFPVYETLVDKQPIAIVQGFVGASGSASLLEELTAMGFTHYIVCGGAGVLQKNIQVGHLVVPISAVRDEGTSYHYLEPSREVECNTHALQVIENQLNINKIPYIKAKTWTTDAFYRETEDKIALRVSEGCVTVEMEASALFAVAKFRNVVLGQILYGGDDLSGDNWDSRKWGIRTEIRKNLVDLALKICLAL